MSDESGVSDDSQGESAQTQSPYSLEGTGDSASASSQLVDIPQDQSNIEKGDISDTSSVSYEETSHNNNGRGNTLSDIMDEVLSGSSYPRHGRHKVITQHTARNSGAEPPVIYQATIFSPYKSKRERFVIYQDDRPFQFASHIGNQTTQVDTIQSGESSVERDSEGRPVTLEDDLISEWVGPVFEVNLVGKAQFQKRITRQGKMKKISTEFPRKTESLLLQEVGKPYIVLKSPHLLRALEGVVGYYPSFHKRASDFKKTLQGDVQLGGKEFQIHHPFAVVMHHFQLIKQLVEDKSSNTHEKGSRGFRRAELQKSHLKHLYEFVEESYHAKVIPCEQDLSGPCPQITFDMIWYLLKPGTDVYAQSDGIVFAGVVLDVKRVSAKSHAIISGDIIESESWSVDFWYLKTDGARIKRTRHGVEITPYSGLRDVADLPVHPVSIWDAKDKGERRTSVLARSRIFLKSLQEGSLLAYHDGPIRNKNHHVWSYSIISAKLKY